MVNDLDPRTVRLKDPGSGLRRPVLVVIPVVAFLALCGVAFAASGGASKKRAVDDGVVVVNVEPTIADTPKKKPMNLFLCIGKKNGAGNEA